LSLSVSPVLADGTADWSGPSVVRDVQSSPVVDGNSTVTWDPPTSEGSSPITSYLVKPVDAHGVVDVYHAVEIDGPAVSAVISGLVDGESYHFDVLAGNDGGYGVDSYIDPQAVRLANNQRDLDELASGMYRSYELKDPAVLAGFAEVVTDPERNVLSFYWKGDVPIAIRERFAPSTPDMLVKFIPVTYSWQEMDEEIARIDAATGADTSMTQRLLWHGISANYPTGTIEAEYCALAAPESADGSLISPQEVQSFLAPFADPIPIRVIPVDQCAFAAVGYPVVTPGRSVARIVKVGPSAVKDRSGHTLISLAAQMSGRPLP
jgi:hypothetical protein